MKHILSAIAAVTVLSTSMAAFAADDAAKEAVKTEAAAVETQSLELKDGTKIEVTGDAVMVIGKDGAKTAAPDGVHTLKDDTTVETKDGKKVAK